MGEGFNGGVRRARNAVMIQTAATARKYLKHRWNPPCHFSIYLLHSVYNFVSFGFILNHCVRHSPRQQLFYTSTWLWAPNELLSTERGYYLEHGLTRTGSIFNKRLGVILISTKKLSRRLERRHPKKNEKSKWENLPVQSSPLPLSLSSKWLLLPLLLPHPRFLPSSRQNSPMACTTTYHTSRPASQ